MKVAVVGSGVSGLAATWLLTEHSDHEVHLYEADSRTGGHAHTVRFHKPGTDNKSFVDVDTGFIVLNPCTYPNFLSFLASQPTVTLNKTEMTFSVSRNDGDFEWAGDTIFTVFCQGLKSLLDPGMWNMLYDILRFNCKSRVLLRNGQGPLKDMAIGDYLSGEGYSEEFIQNYLIPMTSAIWSTPPSKTFASFPARSLLQFLKNHHLLQITGKPKWMTIRGGSKTYIQTILSKVSASQVHLGTRVVALSTSDTGAGRSKVFLTTSQNGEIMEEIYDHVILATHSDTSLSILRAGSSVETEGSRHGVTPLEESILSAIEWNNENEVVLHSDTRLMPKRRPAWSCWNYLDLNRKQADKETVCLTYGMNALQHIPYSEFGPVLVTLNPPKSQTPSSLSLPAPQTIQSHSTFAHPVLCSSTLTSQSRMREIQDKRGIGFAGAWLGWGFHEDGWVSGCLAALQVMQKDKSETSGPGSNTTGGVNGRFGKWQNKPKPTVLLTSDSPFVPYSHLEGVHIISGQATWGGTLDNILVLCFDFLETSGTRVFVGMILGWILSFLRRLFGFA